MYKFGSVMIAAAMLFGTGNALAQTRPQSAPTWQFWLKGQGQLYDNFFQRASGQDQEDVRAVFGEVGTSVGLSRTTPLRAFGSFNDLRFDDNRLDASPGIRVGLRSEGRPHAFEVYVEQLQNRPSFEIGDQFDRADIRNIVGDYSYRFAKDWQVSVSGELQNQDVDVTNTRDNDFWYAGAALRWRRSRLFSPEIGFRTGTRDVTDDTLSYDQDELYLQVRSSPIPPLYLSVRYRNRKRDYTTGVTTVSEFGREDKRRQITVGVDYTISPPLTVNFYGSHENADVNRAGRDFTTALYLLGLTWRF